MISNFILKNLTSLKEIKFGQDFDCDYIYESGGLDWGNVPATHNTYNYPNQVGNSISSSKLETRDVTIEAYVFYVLTDDEKVTYVRKEWQEYAYEKIKEKKAELNKIINPLNYMRLTIGNYYIEGKPSASPKYGITEEDNNIYFCKFLITLYCNNPMFRKLTQTISKLSGDDGSFHFPLSVPPIGYLMGIRNDYLMLNVINEGEIEIGGKIILTAKGTIQNPSIENVNNGQEIKVNKTLHEGEVVEIYTVDGSAKGIFGTYNGNRRSYLEYWDFNNDWIKFEPGLSIISFTTENQSETLLDVKIEINPAKFGLEDM